MAVHSTQFSTHISTQLYTYQYKLCTYNTPSIHVTLYSAAIRCTVIPSYTTSIVLVYGNRKYNAVQHRCTAHVSPRKLGNNLLYWQDTLSIVQYTTIVYTRLLYWWKCPEISQPCDADFLKDVSDLSGQVIVMYVSDYCQ